MMTGGEAGGPISPICHIQKKWLKKEFKRKRKKKKEKKRKRDH